RTRLRRSIARRRRTTKIHLACDGKGRPLSSVITAGEGGDRTQVISVVGGSRGRAPPPPGAGTDAARAGPPRERVGGRVWGVLVGGGAMGSRTPPGAAALSGLSGLGGLRMGGDGDVPMVSITRVNPAYVDPSDGQHSAVPGSDAPREATSACTTRGDDRAA